MSILIKGMDMPKKDTGCRIIILYDGQVAMDNGTFIPDYTAVEIPTPHGRLIDADALFQDLIEHNIPFNNDINSAIIVAPTILEAEEGKEK